MSPKHAAAFLLSMALVGLVVGRDFMLSRHLAGLQERRRGGEENLYTPRLKGPGRVRKLLQSDADIDLWAAALANDTESFLEALEQDPDVNVLIGVGGPCPCTPLIVAADLGNLDIVNALIQAGAIIDKESENEGVTALFAAAQNGFREIVEALLAAGADRNHQTDAGTTPLQAAARGGYYDVVVTLLEKGANSQQGDDFKEAPLHVASLTIGEASVDIVNALLDAGADRNALDSEGWTPLIWATHFGNEGTTKVLLNRGANTELADGDNLTAVDHVCLCEETDEGDGRLVCPIGGCDNGSDAVISEMLENSGTFG